MKRVLVQLVEKVESVEISFLQLALWLVFIGVSRFIFEQVLFLRVFESTNRFQDGSYFILFYTIVFLYSAILVKLFSGQELKKVIRGSVLILPIIFLIPMVDFFLAANPKPYQFISYDLSLIECITQYPGITLLGLYLMFLGAFYVAVKKNIFRAIAAFLSLFGVYYYLLASRLIEDGAKWILSYGLPEILPEDLLVNHLQSTINLLNIVILIGLLIPFTYFYDKTFFRKLLVRLRLERGIQYLSIMFFGFTMVGDFHPFRLYILLLNCLGVFMIWLGSVLVNDFYDFETDQINQVTRNLRLPLERKEMMVGVVILWSMALLIGLQISYVAFFIYLALIIMTYLYSAPPVRFKQYIFSPVLIGFSAFYLVLLGVLTNINLYYYNTKIFQVAALFGLTLAAGANVIDLKDFEGDRLTNIRNLVTVFGMKSAKVIIAVLTGLSYLIIGLVLARVMKTSLYYLAILPACVMPLMVLRYDNSKLWWKVYFLFHIITLFNGSLINIFFANYHLIFKF